ncbi:UNVERIFIED_CONTAM: hypothetical protein Sradi_7260100 [Sesamum radiatum]|uniref:DUF4283 domain-containing protein n=1 Tax=Sesamum radiatum TaxID=300843 RepID=A0AAW2IKR4_SESRA
MENLISLKERWQSKFHTPIDNPKSAKLKSVADREVTPYPSKISLLPRRVSPHLPKSGKRLPSKIQNQMISNPNRLVFQENPVEGSSNYNLSPSIESAQEIFIGKVKLQSNHVDNIADAFLQSSRKTLYFVPPSKEKGEIIIRPSPAIVEKGSQRWQATAVGYFLGKKPYFPILESFARANWKELQQVSATSSGFFFFRFKNKAAMENVIEGGPWLVQGQPIVLQCWEPGMSLRRQKHTRIPVWVRLKHLPMEYWTEEDYARVCVMLDYNSTLPKHLVVMHPMLRDGKEFPTRIDVEYEWLPQRCKQCCSLGHIAQACPENKKVPHGAPVTVFVKKQNTTSEVKKRELETEKRIQNNYPKPTAAIPITDIQSERTEQTNPTTRKEKTLFYTFELLNAEYANSVLEINGDDDRISSGPNASSPQLGDT